MENIKNEVINFVSSEPYYTAEKLGLKPNTVREVDLDDKRFRKLVIMAETGNYGKIQINNGRFIDADNFIRQIEHIAFWKNLVIISWKHS